MLPHWGNIRGVSDLSSWLVIHAHRWWVLMKKQVDVNRSRACVGACCLWDPGDSSPLAESCDLARYLGFLLLHLWDDKLLFHPLASPKLLRNAEEPSSAHFSSRETTESSIAAWRHVRFATTGFCLYRFKVNHEKRLEMILVYFIYCGKSVSSGVAVCRYDHKENKPVAAVLSEVDCFYVNKSLSGCQQDDNPPPAVPFRCNSWMLSMNRADGKQRRPWRTPLHPDVVNADRIKQIRCVKALITGGFGWGGFGVQLGCIQRGGV